MEDTQIPEQAPPRHSFRQILDRIAEPFAIFSVALFVLLLVAQVAVLPLFNKFEINGQKLKPNQLAQYKAQLVQKVNDAESARNDLVLPIKNETYHLLQAQKDALAPIATVKAALEAAARETQGSGSIALSRIHVDGTTVTVRGDVRAGLSSMTVLASFVEKVESLPFIGTFTRPAFTRETDPVLGAHSPFVFSFTSK
jgi:hypothetical protein